jgi:hypothetical protein
MRMHVRAHPSRGRAPCWQTELVLPFYPLEEHFVTTADGFVLRVFRIPHGIANHSIGAGAAPVAPRPVALLQHALMDSSAGWVLLGRRALAFQLADAGFDVWLMNARGEGLEGAFALACPVAPALACAQSMRAAVRPAGALSAPPACPEVVKPDADAGNRYSRNHTRLDPDSDPQFWEFTWADKAELDLPAAAAYIEAVTGQRRLAFMGYSQVGAHGKKGGGLAA